MSQLYSRRKFVIRAGSVAAASVLTTPAFSPTFASAKTPLYKKAKFSDGISSGDPTTSSINLWTRLYGVETNGKVKLEVATDTSFKNVVAQSQLTTGKSQGYSVKAKVSGLDPFQRYYYRFETKDTASPIGRFQTALPADSNETVRFAYCSCQDFGHGYYNVHAVMAQEDIDFIVFLGDFIYAEASETIYGYPLTGPLPVDSRNDKITARTLAQYRDKYHLVRSDKNLRKVLQNFSMIAVWDDHEIQNDYPGSGNKKSPDYDRMRIRKGRKAFFENMPVFPMAGRKSHQIYRSFQFGKSVDLIMCDERSYRENQPCDNAVAPACAELNNERKFLGPYQMQFVKDRLKGSSATWKLIGNQVMIMPTSFGGDYLTYDAWQGYPSERNELTQYIKDNGIEDVAFLTGDIHTFIAGDVQAPDGTVVAPEFVGGSITSACLGELTIHTGNISLPGNDKNPHTSQFLIDTLKEANPHIKETDPDHHGFGLVEAKPDELDVRFRMVKTIKKQSTETIPDLHWVLPKGQVGLPDKVS